MRIPFERDQAGECVFTSELDKFARQTYEANFGEVPEGDITEIKAGDIPPHDLLLAGFPCQAFSHAGLKKGFQDIRGTLFFDIARILDHHRPRAFLLENVKGLKGHDGGKTLSAIIRTLNSLGYNHKIEILNAKDFGLPQNRERIFIVGFRDHGIKFNFPAGKNVQTRLGKILQKRVKGKYTISDRIWAGHQERKERARKKGHGFGYCLFNRDAEYTSTISARYYKDGSEILIEQKGKNPRLLTEKEAARLQGFPDDFEIPVSRGQAYKQFGNAVPVNVIRAIAEEMVRTEFWKTTRG